MTKYDVVANQETSPPFPEDFTLNYIKYIGRHGSRYPSKKNMRRFIKLSEKIKTFLKKKDFDISNINKMSNISYEIKLCENGFRELKGIGTRFRKRFSKYFESNLYKFDFNFHSTCKSRSIQSMEAFKEGFLAGNIPAKTSISKCENDTMYRFFDVCTRYKSLHNCLKEYQIEEELFFKLPHIQNIIKKINQKIGLKEENYLTESEIKYLYISCGFGVSVLNISTDEVPCKFFDEDAFEAFDYMYDIKHFHKKTNFRKINIEISGLLFKEIYAYIIKSFDRCTTDNKDEKLINGDFSFAHAETLFPILVSLGFYSGLYWDY